MTMYELGDVKARVRRFVDSKPKGFVYEQNDASNGLSCYYAKNGKPDCIVGHLLVELGIPVGDLEYDETNPGNPFTRINDGAIEGNFEKLKDRGIEFSHDARTFLIVLQGQQDSGCTWEDSFKHASRVTETAL